MVKAPLTGPTVTDVFEGYGKGLVSKVMESLFVGATGLAVLSVSSIDKVMASLRFGRPQARQASFGLY